MSSYHVKVCHPFQSRYTSQLSNTTNELGYATCCGSLEVFTVIRSSWELWSVLMTQTHPRDYLNTISDIIKESSSMSWKRQCPVPKTLKCIFSHSHSLFCTWTGWVCQCISYRDTHSSSFALPYIRSTHHCCSDHTHSSWMSHVVYCQCCALCWDSLFDKALFS